MYTITLHDGTEIKNLSLNGNNFISDTPLEESLFAGNLQTVHISGPDMDETHENMELVGIRQDGGKYWFVLRELSAQELIEQKMLAYIAALTAASDDMVLLMAELIGG